MLRPLEQIIKTGYFLMRLIFKPKRKYTDLPRLATNKTASAKIALPTLTYLRYTNSITKIGSRDPQGRRAFLAPCFLVFNKILNV